MSEVATAAQNAIGQAQTIVGQVTPVASLFGVGDALAQAGTNLAAAPAAAASLISGLSSAAGSITSTISQTSANIAGITGTAGVGNVVVDIPSPLALLANRGAQSAAVTAGAAVNRATINAQVASGQAVTAMVVHS